VAVTAGRGSPGIAATGGKKLVQAAPDRARARSDDMAADAMFGNLDRGLRLHRPSADAGEGAAEVTPLRVPCFTPGTRVATPEGERPVHELRPGDRVVTRDNGIQEVRWVGRCRLDWARLASERHMRPVLIEAGALGNGLPERDMLVSPQHRVLVANERTQLYFDEREVLVAAKHLINHRSIREIDAPGVTYIHFMCARHEVVLSNGAWTESFQPADTTLKGMGNAQRLELLQLFPELAAPGATDRYASARRTLRGQEAKLLA
jgi:hypothetical protein